MTSPAYSVDEEIEVKLGSKWVRAIVIAAPAGDGIMTVRRKDTGRRVLAEKSAENSRPIGKPAHAFNVREQHAEIAGMGLVAGKARREEMRSVPKPKKATRSRSYADFVRGHACQSCGRAAPSEHAHFGPRGLSQKADDRRANALCSACHRHWHDHGTLPSKGFTEPVAFSRAHSEGLLYRWQTDLLIAWIDAGEGD